MFLRVNANDRLILKAVFWSSNTCRTISVKVVTGKSFNVKLNWSCTKFPLDPITDYLTMSPVQVSGLGVFW